MSGPRVVVVGAGLAGLLTAVRLADAGVLPTVCAKGMGGLSLSPGTIDLLGYDPDPVQDIPAAVAGLVARRPGHPYARIPMSAVADGLATLRQATGVLQLEGSEQQNMLLPTMLGGVRPTSHAPATMAAGVVRPGVRYLLAGFAAMRDAPMALCAANLPAAAAARGIPDVQARAVTLGASPRGGEADVGTVAFARGFDDPAFLTRVAAELAPHVREGELVGLPAVLGVTRSREVAAELGARAGARVFEIATIPPSVPGMRLDAALRLRLTGVGCRVVLGADAVGLERAADGRVTGVRLERGHRVTVEPADAVILATGGLASGAIHVDSHWVATETIAGLPLVGDPRPAERFAASASDDHPGMAMGVGVDDRMRPVAGDGSPCAPNLFAAGGLIGGALPWRELSGEGICLGSAAIAADAAREVIA